MGESGRICMCNPAGCLLSRYCFFVLARSLLIKLAGYSVFNKATQLKIRENHLWFDLLQSLSQYFAPDFEHRAQMRWQAISFRGVI